MLEEYQVANGTPQLQLHQGQCKPLGRGTIKRARAARREKRFCMTKKVLIVDDEAASLDSLRPFLSRSGFIVETARDGVEALERIDKVSPDIIVLDVLMPHIDGRQVLRELRDREIWTPVILLTAVGDATERAMALTEGADDYLNKPYDPHELVARIGSILRRTQRGSATLATADVLTAGSVKFDRKARIASKDSARLNLTPRATHLLEYMMLHPGELLARERILDAVWGWHFVTGTRSVDARVVELRKALEDDSAAPVYIETVPGEGYRFIAPTRSGA